MKKLSIIILSYNVKKLLLDCLKSLPVHKDWEIIVVDNASTDGSDELATIKNKTNSGFSAGNNVGIKKSIGEYILLLNPDTKVYPNSIETVLEYMEKHPDVGAATCRVELPDGSLDYSSHRSFPDPINSLLHFFGLKNISSYTNLNVSDEIHEIDALTGAFAMVRRTAGEQVDWLDEDYFFNAEDIDLCYKLKEKDWKIIYIPDVKITHFKGSSAKASPESRKLWASHSTDAMRIFYQKHLAKKYPFFINWSVYLGIRIIRLVRSIYA